jgi:5'-3' exonuclease
MYEDYKKNRRRKTEIDNNSRYILEYLRELQELFRVLPLLGVDQAWSDGWEADDVMGTLARAIKEKPILILTRDGDILQLVRNDVHVLLRIQSNETIYTPAVVLKEKGFTADKITDWKSIAGDGGDDVPGIRGIGKTTATEIVKYFPTFIPEVIAGTYNKFNKDYDERMCNRTIKAIRKISHQEDTLRIMRWLVELHNVPVTFKRSSLDSKAAIDRLKLLGLKTAATRAKVILGGKE